MDSKLTSPHSMFLSPLKLVCVQAEYEYVDGDRNFSLVTGGISRFEEARLLLSCPSTMVCFAVTHSFVFPFFFILYQ